MSGKYLRTADFTQNYVFYFVVDKNNEIVTKSGYDGMYGWQSACFGHIFRRLPETATSVYVFHSTKLMGYNEPEIIRYINDLCEMGFKCEYLGCSLENTVFRINLKDMETKNQFGSTLTLIRCLYEANSVKIPERYLVALDNDPTMDKFEALQNAHKVGELPLGHNVTSRALGSNITLQKLYERFKIDGRTPFSESGTSINKCWADDEHHKTGKYYDW